MLMRYFWAPFLRYPVITSVELSIPPPRASREGRGAGDLVQFPMANDLVGHDLEAFIQTQEDSEVLSF